jgi:Arc/MetJ-type ribon-helix-helix transcriptional regulator
MRTIKTQIVFPENVLEELDRNVKSRERSDFVVEAVEEKLQRLRFGRALRAAAGVWQNRGDMKTDREVQTYLKKIRRSDQERHQKLQKTWRRG